MGRFSTVMRCLGRIGIGVAGAAALVTWCAGSESRATDPGKIPVTLQLKWLHQAQFAGFYAADRTGLYRKAGLEVKLIPGGPGIDPMAPVLDGTAQFGIASAVQIVMARAEGKPVVAVASILRRNPVVFFSAADKGITRPYQLAGRSIRFTADTRFDVVAMLGQFGIPSDQYRLVEIASKVEEFRKDLADVWAGYVISIQAEVQDAGIAINTIYPDDFRVHIPGDTLFARADFVEANRDLVVNFVKASLDGWRYAMANVGKTLDMVLNVRPELDRSGQERQLLLTIPLIDPSKPRLGWIAPAVWDLLIQSLWDAEVLERRISSADVFPEALLVDTFPPPSPAAASTGSERKAPR